MTTIRSKNPCPVCGGKKWYVWFVGRSELYDGSFWDLATVDESIDWRSYRTVCKSEYTDLNECAKCGTVVT
jgi:hypothetical protein